MNWFLNGLFLLTCYPILFLCYFMFKKIHDKNGYCFGASVKPELRETEELKTIVAEYQKRLKKMTIIMAVLPLSFFFIPYMSIVLSLWMLWILIVCCLPMIWMGKANRKVLELKRQYGWDTISTIAYTELKSADEPRKVKFSAFFPALLCSTIPIFFAGILFWKEGYGVYIWITAMFAMCTYLFYGTAVWTDKQKIAIICTNSNTNVNFARAKKQAWKNYWLMLAWMNTVFVWLVLLFMWQRSWGMYVLIWTSVAYGLAAIFMSIWLMKKLQNINDAYASRRTIRDVSDDDRHWIYGMMYYNKNDKHLLVENRMGTGTAINMATGVGKVGYLITLLSLLAIPILCIWLIMLEFTPLMLKVEDERIICQQLKVEYEIPLTDIEAYDVISDLPEMIKVNGTNMDNLLLGTYEIYREGMLEAFLNPKNDVFIKITTADKTYYISGADDAKTQEIIEILQK